MQRVDREMASQNSDVQNSNIIESMNKAFDNGNFYGLEYVLDELDVKMPPPKKQNAVDWFGFWDNFD